MFESADKDYKCALKNYKKKKKMDIKGEKNKNLRRDKDSEIETLELKSTISEFFKKVIRCT